MAASPAGTSVHRGSTVVDLASLTVGGEEARHKEEKQAKLDTTLTRVNKLCKQLLGRIYFEQDEKTKVWSLQEPRKQKYSGDGTLRDLMDRFVLIFDRTVTPIVQQMVEKIDDIDDRQRQITLAEDLNEFIVITQPYHILQLRNTEGRTILHITSYQGRMGWVEFFLKYACLDHTYPDLQGRTALQLVENQKIAMRRRVSSISITAADDAVEPYQAIERLFHELDEELVAGSEQNASLIDRYDFPENPYAAQDGSCCVVM